LRPVAAAHAESAVSRPNIQTGSIGRLYSVLTCQPSAVLLLGAGASLRSGIPLAGGVVEKAARWAYARDNGRSDDDPRLQRSDWLPWLRKLTWYDDTKSFAENYPYVVEHLLQPRQARAEFFRKLLNPGVDPSPGYDKLAEFLHIGPVKNILTTNFDTILPQVRVLKRRPHVIDVIQTAADYTKFSTTPLHPQLVYLHGSVDHYTDRNLIDEVQRLDGAMVTMLVPLLRDHPLVVVGYRGAEPSVMKHLLIENAESTNHFRHGIFWCKLKSDEILSPSVVELANTIGANFTVIEIDGFDELFSRDLWNLHLDNRKQGTAAPAPAEPIRQLAATTFEMAAIKNVKVDDLDWATLRTRILQYCRELQIGIPQQADRAWITEQLLQLNLASKERDGTVHATRAGDLLFGNRPQQEVSSARIVVRATGPSDWLATFKGKKDDVDPIGLGSNSGEFGRTVEGNLWVQCDSVLEILGSFNRPFRLKGEQSESVLPYPPLALKEVVVNALVHRDYASDDTVVVDIEPSKIRIFNPGGLVDEVKRRVEPHSIEGEIRRGRRGIKGYRNPVLADLFYGSGDMDKAGSGLSDVFKLVRENGGDVRFGPILDNAAFEVEIFARPESVDEITGTASPIVMTTTRYAANMLEVLELPSHVFHAATPVRNVWEIWKARPGEWIPPFSLLDDRIYSFHDLSSPANPLRSFIDADEPETLSVAAFSKDDDGSRRFVRILNLCFEQHLYRRGLIVDRIRKRAYFPRPDKGGPLAVTYQARLRRAKRTVVKVRSSPRTGAVSYWEHESLGYRFERFGDVWAILLEPGYVFTFDGKKKLLAPEKVNKLSTKRAARDYNSAVHNDLSFWTWLLAGGESEASFLLDLGPPTSSLNPDRRPEESGFPTIAISSRLPTVAVNDAALAVGEPDEEGLEEEMAELEEELDKLADEERTKAGGRDDDQN
jgi:predicted HTH transcriptional regulator